MSYIHPPIGGGSWRSLLARDYPLRHYPSLPMSASEAGCHVGRQFAMQNASNECLLHLTDDEMSALLEYSASIPSKKYIGKRWRMRTNRKGTLWVVKQYAELHPEDKKKWPGEIAILTYTPVIDNGKPGVWREKDKV